MDQFVSNAQFFACQAHGHATRKDGSLQIHHVHRVARKFTEARDSATAFLHDVVEDTHVTIDEIREQFGDVVADAIDAVTRRDGEAYFDYIRRCKQNEIARRVKLADLADNNQPDQLRALGETGLIERYMRAACILIAADEDEEAATTDDAEA